MGLFDFLKKKDKQQEQTVKNSNETEVSVLEAEKKYYQPDEYYTKKSHEGTMFEKTVITFEERKKHVFHQIEDYMLLKYCYWNIVPMANIQDLKMATRDFGGLHMELEMWEQH